jgi:AcrR family transcriptional regulator
MYIICIFVEMNGVKDKVREEIIKGASVVFETYGLERASMQDISKASKKGRSTLYYYFNNKMEVLDAVAERTCKIIFAECKAKIKMDAPLEQNMTNFHKQKLQETRKLNSRFHLVLKDLRTDPSTMLIKFRLYMDEEIMLIHKMLDWSIERKEIAYLNNEDRRFLAETFVTAFKSFEQEIMIFDRLPNMEAKLSWLCRIFCKGLK